MITVITMITKLKIETHRHVGPIDSWIQKCQWNNFEDGERSIESQSLVNWKGRTLVRLKKTQLVVSSVEKYRKHSFNISVQNLYYYYKSVISSE